VAATCVVSLVLLRPELVQVPYLNDSAMHEEMVRFALQRIREGHFPPDSWFPFLNLGSPQYLHYQSLAAMLTALLAWGIGVGRAFTLTTWLLVACWPLCIYGAARVFGLRRGAAAAAAVCSPFVSSFTHVGYEQISYLWGGYGLWSQLFAMWTLPFAWALSWRAVEERRYLVPAAVLVAATTAFHFETGYLAFAGIVVFVLARPSKLWRRAGRGALVAAGGALAAAWVIVPLVAQGRWAAVNEYLQSGPAGVDANSYGARQVLAALVEGNLFDWHHVPLLTPLLALGFVYCLASWRRPAGAASDIGAGRALVLAFVASLVLFFGRPTLGPLLDLVPGARDLFLRRFVVGVQLAGLLLAGVGAAKLASWVVAESRRLASRRTERHFDNALAHVALVCVALALLVPAWAFVVDQADEDASFVATQSSASRATSQIDAIIATIEHGGGGRTFAGDPSDWGAQFDVGEVPVFKYLASKDVDEVGFTLRTASLMSDPEQVFDEDDPADYAAFGVRWLILPTGKQPPMPAEAIEQRGPYALWRIPGDGYVEVVDTRGTIAASSSDLGSFAGPFLAGLPSLDPVFATVAYGGAAAAAGTLTGTAPPTTAPGSVLTSRADLANGTVSATVSLSRTAVVLLSASYDPGWQVLVDGHVAATEMVAPALVGVRVGPGVHTVRFVYRGYPDYPELAALGIAAIAALALSERRHGRTGRRGGGTPA
jgi:hypothetical protein